MISPVFEVLSFSHELKSTHVSFSEAVKAWEDDLTNMYIRCVWGPKHKDREITLSNANQISIYADKLVEWSKEQPHEDYWDTHLQKAMTEQKKDAINPSHYQAYIQTEKEVLQWLEAMQYLPRFRDPECLKAAVELQARKYMDRNGGKDAELQELQKGLWYFKFLVAFIKNGNKPIRVENIDKILNG